MPSASTSAPRGSRAFRALTGTGKVETPEVREALALTLAEPRVLAIFTFAWTQLLAWTVLAVSGSLLPLLWVVADVAVFSVRLALSYRHDAALRTGSRPPREAMVATDLVGYVLVSVGIGASLSVDEPVLSILLALVSTGICGYVTARLAAFPRMAGLVLYFTAGAFGAGIANSPVPGAWMLGLLAPGVATGFLVLTVHNHRILVGSVRAQQENRRLSLRDPLTGLANRLQLYEALADLRGRAGAGAGDDRVAVLCLDLDGFKCINDVHGHPGGDRLLEGVAERLSSCAGAGDVVARLGGDEFVVVAPGAGRDEAVALAARLITAVSAPYAIGSETAAVGVSIGISLGPEHGVDPQDLLDHADGALYAVKRRGKGHWQLHDGDPSLLRTAV